MKKSLLALLCVFLILSIGSYGLIKLIGPDKSNSSESTSNTLVTSFYPEYIIVKNIIDSCNNINLVNMTSKTSGCLHDYQITSKDMKTLTNCDALIINGGGMEPFIDDINKALPNLPIIDSSNGIDLLEGTHIHSHSHDEHCDNESSVELNSHIWLNPDYYIKQIKTITSNLCTIYPEYNTIFNTNSKKYITKINKLKDEIKKCHANKDESIDVIIFHYSFAYLAPSIIA